MKFLNLIIVRISLAMALGIIVASQLSDSFSFLLKWALPIWFMLLFTRIVFFKRISPKPYFGLITITLFFLIGMINFQKTEPRFTTHHFTHAPSEETTQHITLKITEGLKSNVYQDKFVAKVASIDGRPTSGKILLLIPKEKMTQTLSVDDELYVYSEIQLIPKALNPYQFDYKRYLEHQGIFAQVRLSENELIFCGSGASSIKGIAHGFRMFLIQKLQKASIDLNERSILQALVLGYRNDISEETYQNYAAAGAIHILAVSGLHVGILFIIFSKVLSPITVLRKGKVLRAIIVVILLWCYAFIAGGSPSVVRAVTMFSFFALAEMLDRPTNSFNTLFLSFFLLIILEPRWIFHVGFQMSYLAVFFILWLQPKIYKWYRPKFYLDQLFWSIVSVSLAAQIGIAPLSIFYFNQFPGLFLLTNLVILPVLSFLLLGGLIIILLAAMEMLPDSIAFYYNEILLWLNNFIAWVAEQESFLLKNLTLSTIQLLLLYVLLFFGMKMSTHRCKKYLFYCGGVLVLFYGTKLYETRNFQKEKLILFHRTAKTILVKQSGSKLQLFSNDSMALTTEYPLKSFIQQRKIKEISITKVPNYFVQNGHKTLLIDSASVYPRIKVHSLLLVNSPKINLDRAIDSLEPRLIIADGSNYKSYVQRWMLTALKRKLPFHYTGEKGAFIIGKE